MSPIRLATVGTSAITENLLEAAREVEGVEFVGAMSRDASRATEFARSHGAELSFASVGELAASDAVDAVYVASPNALHFEQALELAAAGRHLLVEKPLCATRRQAEVLLAVAENHGVVAMEAMRPVHDPAWATMAAAVPTLGRIRRATLRFGKYSSRYDRVLAGEQTNIFDCRMASGALMDLGVYCVEPMVALFGRPAQVLAASVPVSPADCATCGGAIDGAGSALCRYGEGTGQFVVELAWSKISDDRLPSQIEGERATLVMDAPNTPQRARVERRGQATPAIKATDPTSVGDSTDELAIAPCANSMVFELRDFVALVRGECVATQWGELDAAAAARRFSEVSLASLAVCDEIRRQAGIVFPADAC